MTKKDAELTPQEKEHVAVTLALLVRPGSTVTNEGVLCSRNIEYDLKRGSEKERHHAIEVMQADMKRMYGIKYPVHDLAAMYLQKWEDIAKNDSLRASEAYDITESKLRELQKCRTPGLPKEITEKAIDMLCDSRARAFGSQIAR